MPPQTIDSQMTDLQSCEGGDGAGAGLQSPIPISLIRKHLKIDDYAGVDDDQLALYAAAAIETFERYTGFVVGKRRQVREHLKIPRWSSATQAAVARTMVTLSHPVDDGMILLEAGGRSEMIAVEPGARELVLPASLCDRGFIANACSDCDPAGGAHASSPTATYTTGTGAWAGVYGTGLPPGALVGALKLIAWQYEHPGDELATIADAPERVTASGQQGTNDALIGSGAADEWYRYKRVAR